MSLSVISNEKASTLAASGGQAARRIVARLAALIPHRAYAPGDRCPFHPADKFFPATGDGAGQVFCAESGVLHPRKMAS